MEYQLAFTILNVKSFKFKPIQISSGILKLFQAGHTNAPGNNDRQAAFLRCINDFDCTISGMASKCLVRNISSLFKEYFKRIIEYF